MFRSLTFVGARVDIVLLNDILLCCHRFESLLPNYHCVLVGEEGFEPPYDRTKTCCLTAWRLPNCSHTPQSRHSRSRTTCLEDSTAPLRKGSRKRVFVPVFLLSVTCYLFNDLYHFSSHHRKGLCNEGIPGRRLFFFDDDRYLHLGLEYRIKGLGKGQCVGRIGKAIFVERESDRDGDLVSGDVLDTGV